MNSTEKLHSLSGLQEWRSRLRATGKRLVVTNGCFDLLHVGHVNYLEGAKALGDFLLVGVNGDDSVRALKGPGRPINSEEDRARVLAALQCVDGVCIFRETKATQFLQQAQPDIYVKGGDYTIESLEQEERHLVETAGGKIVLMPLVPGKSTSAVLRKVEGG